MEVLTQIQDNLNRGESVRSMNCSEEVHAQLVKPLQLITDKPVMYVCNVDEGSAV